MRAYIIYRDENNQNVCIVELLNECDMLNVQKDLIVSGYIILETIFGRFIRCRKVDEEEL